ncbi:MAG: hypothetical protein AB7I18_12745 [Candidatus Berkiella sp.]
MATTGPGKYNLFNLMGAEPEAKLKRILASVDIDYQQHFPNGANQETKEAALANILNSIQTSRKLILFKTLIESNFATDQHVIKAQNIEKNIEQVRVVSFITKKILNALIEEAINQYLTEEQIKAIRVILGELRRKYESEKDERLKMIYETEIQRILADEVFQRNLQRLNQEYKSRIKEHDENLDKINLRIDDIKDRKYNIVDEASKSVSAELTNHTAINSNIAVYRDVIPEEHRDAFMRDFLKECYRAEKNELKKSLNVEDQLQKYIDMDKHDQAKVAVQLPPLANYRLARNNDKSIPDLVKKEPDYERIFQELCKKYSGKPELLNQDQIAYESSLLAEKFKPAVDRMLEGKKEKIDLRKQCVEIEAQKQKEKIQLQNLYNRLELDTSKQFKKTPAALEFDEFLATVEITPKSAKTNP